MTTEEIIADNTDQTTPELTFTLTAPMFILEVVKVVLALYMEMPEVCFEFIDREDLLL